MHEMSLAEGVLQLMEDSAKTQGFARVKTVWLEIGQLSGAEPEAMRFCFDAVMRGSLAENASLEIIETPGSGLCADCGSAFEVAARYEPCPRCGSYAVQIIGGDAMRVKELEVE